MRQKKTRLLAGSNGYGSPSQQQRLRLGESLNQSVLHGYRQIHGLRSHIDSPGCREKNCGACPDVIAVFQGIYQGDCAHARGLRYGNQFYSALIVYGGYGNGYCGRIDIKIGLGSKRILGTVNRNSGYYWRGSIRARALRVTSTVVSLRYPLEIIDTWV